MTQLPVSAEFDLAIARSQFLDAYADLEDGVRALLMRLGIAPLPMLGQNLDMLAKTKPAPQYSKAHQKAVQEILLRIKPLQETRCDIVHARMKIVVMENKRYACFANPQKCQRHAINATLISKPQFDAMIASLQKITKELLPTNPASSPRTPLPGATDGP